jgi:Immunoglobulin V-set domain
VFLKIPEQPIYAGDDVNISCHYNLEEDRLGSIKWYKDNQLFMWYSPRDRVPIRGFPAVGVNMEEKLLRPYTIMLKNLGLDSAGEYSCEVAAEAPSQQRQTATARLTVHGDNDGRTTEEVRSGCITFQPNFRVFPDYDNVVGYRPAFTNDADSRMCGVTQIVFGLTALAVTLMFHF